LVIIVGVALVIAGLVGLLSSQKLKRPLSLMLFIGIVLSVGAYPSDSSSPLWSYFADNPKSAISLALRSSSRAVPLIALTLAIGVALTVEQSKKFLSLRSPRVSSLALPVAVLLICLNVPALFGGRYIDPAISRPENLPTAWTQAAALLDTRLDEGHTGSVLILPGIESAAYRWGYPVDPILPGITKKPLITRDWLPLGSAPFMDLLYALDDSFQNGTADPNSIAPIARLLGADTIMVVNSYQYERFGVNRPERAASLIDAAPDLEVIATFGEPSINFVEDYETNDLLDYPATALPEISLYAVSDSVAGARITQNPIVVSADGSGMVDLAAAGLIDGKSSILASAALDEISLQDAVLNAPEVIVTDSNRKRAHQWRGSQEVWGATEGTAALVDSFDAFDNRLPVFPLGADRLETLSIAENNSGTSMSATMYGALLSYLPEYRPANANDGNVETSWAVGWGVNPIGQTLTYTSNMGLPMVEQLELIPAQFSFDHRFVTAVSVSVDNSDWTSYTIDPDTENTTIKLNQPGNSVRVRIDAVSSGNNQLPVGWAEILRADFQHQEVITVPSDATAVVTAATPVSYSFTRLQADEYKPYRQDPEQSINRHFFVDHEDQFTLTGHATSTTDFAASDICRDDLITIDGTIIPVRLSNVEGDQDQTFSFVGCEPVNLKIGHRTLLTSYDTSIHVDRIVLRSVSAQQPEASVVAPLAQSRTTRTTSINSCTSGCWLELNDGWNIGWEGSLAGQTLRDPVASAGGRLLWRLPDTRDGTQFATIWTPQMRMWIGIAITLIGLIFGLVVLSLPRLRRRTLRPDAQDVIQPLLVQSGITAVTYAAIIGAIVISPLYGILAGLIAAATFRSRSMHKAGLALIALGMMFLIAQQIRTGADPSFGWPSVFRRAHRPVLLGIVLISLSSWMAPRPKQSTQTERTSQPNR
jgi:hypothetical protein